MSTVTSRARLLSVAEVVGRTGFSPTTVYRALETGALQGFKTGRARNCHWRVRVEDMEAWLEGSS